MGLVLLVFGGRLLFFCVSVFLVMDGVICIVVLWCVGYVIRVVSVIVVKVLVGSSSCVVWCVGGVGCSVLCCVVCRWLVMVGLSFWVVWW